MDFGEIGKRILERLFGGGTEVTSKVEVRNEFNPVLPPPTVIIVSGNGSDDQDTKIIDVVPDESGEVAQIEDRDWTTRFVAKANAEQKVKGGPCSVGEWVEEPPKK